MTRGWWRWGGEGSVPPGQGGSAALRTVVGLGGRWPRLQMGGPWAPPFFQGVMLWPHCQLSLLKAFCRWKN